MTDDSILLEDSTYTEPLSGEFPETRLLGNFRLLQRLGEGGMGEVWEAEQLEPVKRLVAIKLIKRGMDSEQVLARFETERQALALMDHPAIAKVFDAGTTQTGRPYFVMEHVQGVSITRYCDRHRLNVRERLELFLEVCEGIQHAHQKAVIHRDIKPSNILVTDQEGRTVPKIIDFGVAKATADDEREHALYHLRRYDTKMTTRSSTGTLLSKIRANPRDEGRRQFPAETTNEKPTLAQKSDTGTATNNASTISEPTVRSPTRSGRTRTGALWYSSENNSTYIVQFTSSPPSG